MRRLQLILVIVISTCTLKAQNKFEPSSWLTLGELWNSGGQPVLADFDNDKDLDLMISYALDLGGGNTSSQTKLYFFEGNGFVDSEISLPYFTNLDLYNVIDINNDGFLDLYTVEDVNVLKQVKFYINQNGSDFLETLPTGVPIFEGIWEGGIAWADYDNDGDQDFVLRITVDLANQLQAIKIFENKGDLRFQESVTLSGGQYLRGYYPWGDYDNDGDLDIVACKQIKQIICQSSICNTVFTVTIGIYENFGNKNFVYKDLGLKGIGKDWVDSGDISWGDLNSDGYLDLLLTGIEAGSSGEVITKLYVNNKNKSFSEQNSDAIQAMTYDIQIGWGDSDNDGDYDAMLYGVSFGESTNNFKIYSNTEGNLTMDTDLSFINAARYGSFQIGDIDNDHDLDIVIAGEENFSTPRILVYKNNQTDIFGNDNNQPTAPSNLLVSVDKANVALSWASASDQETKQAALTYEYYLIYENDTIVASYSHPDGTRKVAQMGNTQHTTFRKLENLKPGQYRWGVQAIDAGYRGSEFSSESTFEIEKVAPVATVASDIGQTNFKAHWYRVPNVIEYRLDVSDDNFVTFIDGYEDRLVSDTSELVIGLEQNTQYTYRIRAVYDNGVSTNSNTIDANTLDVVIGITGDENVIVNIMPNPATNFIYVSGFDSRVNPIIYDLKGVEVKAIINYFEEYIEIYIGNLSKGLYLLKGEIADRTVIKKFLKE